jgi:hypothetical protein
MIEELRHRASGLEIPMDVREHAGCRDGRTLEATGNQSQRFDIQKEIRTAVLVKEFVERDARRISTRDATGASRRPGGDVQDVYVVPKAAQYARVMRAFALVVFSRICEKYSHVEESARRINGVNP